MSKLKVNFVNDPQAGSWARWVLLGLGMLLAADVGRNIVATYDALERAEARAGRVARLAPVSIPTDPEALERQTAAAQEIVERMALPWNTLFVELEKARTENVSLLSVEPDAATRALLLTGEAKDLYTMASYVATLKESKRLTDVHLARHEQRKNEPQRPVAFNVNANWKNLQ